MFFEDLTWRGLIHQTTDDEGLPQWLEEQPRTCYIGFDPTADSLHAGSLVQLMYLRRFQRAGHRPIALVGGATGMIGDPSGKSKERNLLSVEALEANVEGIAKQMQQFLDFDGPAGAKLVNNFDWMKDFSFLDFLRDVGKNAPVNVMMTKDSVKNRLESGISFTEFSYMLLQAYDFVHLHQNHGCELQLGGSDQWGNITAGIDLGRRMFGAQLFGITCPLLTKSDGSKMGKTEDGTVWLDSNRTSPYKFFQYWRNVGDDDVGGCLRMLTELPREEIEALDKSRTEDPSKRESQQRLASWLTQLVHGEDGLDTAHRATKIFFGEAVQNLTSDQVSQIFADVPSCELTRSELEQGVTLIDALTKTSLAKSKGEARRTITDGGAYVNNVRATEIDRSLGTEDLIGESAIILRKGKKNFAVLRFA